MDYVIAIPSYNRANEQLTLNYFKQIGIDAGRVYLFIQTEDDFEKYQIYKNSCHIILNHAENVAQNRNNILNYFDNNVKIAMMEDDIHSMKILKNKKLYDMTIDDVNKFIETGYALCNKYKTICFGVYFVCNQFFMNNKIVSPALCEGGFMGIINNKDVLFDPRFTLKEDFEFSCKIIKEFRNLIRFNYVTLKAKHRSKGGCKLAWNTDQKEMFELILNLHGDILKPNPKRKYEVLLKK